MRSSLQKWLKAAAVYNLAYGAFCVLFPHLIFEWMNIAIPLYLEFWQCIGMIVGVYGLGYWWASKNYIRHWPIVAVGLLGKIFGPIGFVYSVYIGKFPLAFGFIILFNDLIWWPSFSMMIKEAWKEHGFKE